MASSQSSHCRDSGRPGKATVQPLKIASDPTVRTPRHAYPKASERKSPILPSTSAMSASDMFTSQTSPELSKFRIKPSPIAGTSRNANYEPCLNEMVEHERLAWQGVPEKQGSQPHSFSPPLSTPRLQHRSQFVEGSMTQRSKAVSSTWQQICHAPSSEASIAISETSQRDPRLPFSECAGVSASIDLKEFKPLPETPTNLKHTVKKLGQRMRGKTERKANFTTEPHVKVNRGSRRGLQKSLATWKLGGGARVNEHACSNTKEPEYEYSTSFETQRTVKHLSSLLRKELSQPCESRDQVPADRKRKAEMAYSEQFGTAKKRLRMDLAYVNGQHLQPSCAANVHQQPAVDETNMTTSNQKSSFESPSDHRQIAVVLSSGDQPSTARHVQKAMASCKEVGQAMTRGRALLSLSPNSTDQLKRSSRNELEKENRQLRALLRESRSRTKLSRSSSRMTDVQATSPRLVSRPVIPAHGSSAGQLFRIFEDEHGQQFDNIAIAFEGGDTLYRPTNATGQKPCLTEKQTGDEPFDVNGIDVFEPIGSGTRTKHNTLTSRRKQSSRPAISDFKLMRSLSQVRETLDDGKENPIVHMAQAGSPRTYTGDPEHYSYDGVSEATAFSRVGVAIDAVAGQSVQECPAWEWPDDVF